MHNRRLHDLTRIQEVDQHGNVIPADSGSPEWGPLNGARVAMEIEKANGIDRSAGNENGDRSESPVRVSNSQDISLHNQHDYY